MTRLSEFACVLVLCVCKNFELRFTKFVAAQYELVRILFDQLYSLLALNYSRLKMESQFRVLLFIGAFNRLTIAHCYIVIRSGDSVDVLYHARTALVMVIYLRRNKKMFLHLFTYIPRKYEC